MKKTMLIATFLAVGAGSAGVSAVDLKRGSDTLKEFTLSVINAAVCPGADGLVYIGGGSGAGETAMIPGTQPVRPCRASSLARWPGRCQTEPAPKALRSLLTASPLCLQGALCVRSERPLPARAAADARKPPAVSATRARLASAATCLAAALRFPSGWRDVLRLVLLRSRRTATGKNPEPPRLPHPSRL